MITFLKANRVFIAIVSAPIVIVGVKKVYDHMSVAP